jgi:hypothetical protein
MPQSSRAFARRRHSAQRARRARPGRTPAPTRGAGPTLHERVTGVVLARIHVSVVAIARVLIQPGPHTGDRRRGRASRHSRADRSPPPLLIQPCVTVTRAVAEPIMRGGNGCNNARWGCLGSCRVEGGAVVRPSRATAWRLTQGPAAADRRFDRNQGAVA